MKHATLGALALLALTTDAAGAQPELSFYGSAQTPAPGLVSGSDPGGLGDYSFVAGWKRLTEASDLQFGIRLTWWASDAVGWGLDMSHMPVRADAETLSAHGLTSLGFGNGSNTITLNTWRRWNSGGNINPYVGAGVGISLPRVEFESAGGRTSQFEVAGPAIQLYAGASYALNDRLSVFGEYKGSFSSSKARLANGGTFNTDTLDSAVNIGVSLGF